MQSRIYHCGSTAAPAAPAQSFLPIAPGPFAPVIELDTPSRLLQLRRSVWHMLVSGDNRNYKLLGDSVAVFIPGQLAYW